MHRNPKKLFQSKVAARHQQGAALIIFALVLLFAGSIVFFSYLDSNGVNAERSKKTAAALAEAKAALIGHAASVSLLSAGPRPGDLPCPDNHTPGDTLEGTSSTPCNGNAIGRLPWKTLGITDLRDGSGERLWYAVSNNFKNSTRTTCTAPGQAGCLNSDTVGTITLRSASGVVVNNASTGTGVIAVIFAPGSPITRADGGAQDRGCGGCSVVASNYLDIVVGTDDNASFANSSATDGFIQGPIKDASGNFIINDTMIAITTTDLMPLLEKRIAGEALSCLRDYALTHSGGLDRHPWTTNGASITYADTINSRFGRIPDAFFTSTETTSGGAMQDTWGAGCNIPTGTWWQNWKEQVFYAVAYDFDPNNIHSPMPVCPNDCLTITTPSGDQLDKKVAIIVAGKSLTGQSRGTNIQKQNLSNYLEDYNSSTAVGGVDPDGNDHRFEQKAATSTFNDVIVFY